METVTFKTNIKCLGCVESARPFLNEAAGENNWEVDTDNPDKLLTISGSAAAQPQEVIRAVEQAGYTAVAISNEKVS